MKEELKKPRVFITQVPGKRDPATNSFVPTVNIAPAIEHGEIVIMLPPESNFHATVDLIKHLRNSLNDYDFDRGDSLVALGDPSVIAVAAALLGSMGKRFTLLKWDRMVSRYLPVQVQV